MSSLSRLPLPLGYKDEPTQALTRPRWGFVRGRSPYRLGLDSRAAPLLPPVGIVVDEDLGLRQDLDAPTVSVREHSDDFPHSRMEGDNFDRGLLLRFNRVLAVQTFPTRDAECLVNGVLQLDLHSCERQHNTSFLKKNRPQDSVIWSFRRLDIPANTGITIQPVFYAKVTFPRRSHEHKA